MAMGGMTNRWVVEAIKAQDWLQSSAQKVSIPVLLLEAEVDDFVCTSRPFSHLCRESASCRRLFYLAVYHEVLFEKEWARSHAIESGEYPASDERTVVAPPPLSEEERQQQAKRRVVVRRICLVAVATGLAVAAVVVTLGARGRK